LNYSDLYYWCFDLCFNWCENTKRSKLIVRKVRVRSWYATTVGALAPPRATICVGRVLVGWCAGEDEPLQLVIMCSTAAGLDHAKKLANNLLDTVRADWDANRCALAAPQEPCTRDAFLEDVSIL
jgi:hypothetical protein